MVNKMSKKILTAFLLIVVIVVITLFLRAEKIDMPVLKIAEKDFVIVAENLQIPWELAFLPDGDILVTERPGTLRQIGKNKRTYTIEGVNHIGEGGLLGLALHPRFKENHFLYLYLTIANNGGFINQVERYRLENNRLQDKKIIISNIPGAAIHNGGRIAFGPDGYLYITTGETGRSEGAQNKTSLEGKILRLKDDGSIPADNPFGNAIYSYGHRNPQGITWDKTGRLWETEHGRSGLLSGLDEVNLIEKGENYGWPLIQGDETREGMEKPILHSGSRTTWAPAGMDFKDNMIFFGGLRGESLYRLKIIDNKQVSLKTYWPERFGRIRVVVFGPDGFLYIATSNTDGRGSPQKGDDKIIKINPRVFKN